MFKIPKSVTIGGLEYNIRFEENMVRDKSRTGESSGNKQELVIDPGMSKQIQETTFIHEVLHQIDFVYNIGLEHQAVFQLEAGIYAFLKSNNLVTD
jgi:hypothetical protein